MPGCETLLTLHEDLVLETPRRGQPSLVAPHWRLPLGDLPEGALAALRRLAGGAPVTREELAAEAMRQGGPAALAPLFLVLERLGAAGGLCELLRADGRDLTRLVPLGRSDGAAPAAAAAPLDEEATYTLSRFALQRVDGGVPVLESPLAHARLQLLDPLVATLLHALALPRTPAALAAAVPGLSGDALRGALGQLLRQRLLVATVDGRSPEGEPPLASWEVHDLYFHSRSRRGRHDGGYGGTYRLRGAQPPPEAVAHPAPPDSVPLEAPDLGALAGNGATLSAVLERRRSLRRHGAVPLHRRQLGELLYRSARIVEQVATDEGGLTRRPYPSGGSLYALEIYPLIDRCTLLAPGLWRYLPASHALAPVAPLGREAERLLDDAGHSWGQPERPQVLLIVAARFARVAWKYESLAYALLLKDLGALLQTLYLVATDLDLAPCALGGGDSDLFARVAGLDYLAEGAIGEMAVGSRDAAGAGEVR